MEVSASMLIEWQDGADDVAGHTFSGWDSRERYTGVAPEFELGGVDLSGDNTILINPDTGASPKTDIHYTTAAALGAQAGDSLNSWGLSGSDIHSIQFDFYADAAGGTPDGLGFYFAAAGGNAWYYTIGNAYIQTGWNTYEVALSYNANAYGTSSWYGWPTDPWGGGPALGSGDFTSDLAAADFADYIGFFIQYDSSDSLQSYQIDNFGLTVPEPETYLVLGMALLSIAVVFRKRISDSLAEARTMMHA